MEQDITELLSEIARECQFNPEEDGLEQWFQKCKRWLGLEKESRIEIDEEENEEDDKIKDVPESLQNVNSPFYIRNSGQILKIEREEELKEYKRKLLNLKNLEQVIENYSEERIAKEWIVSIFKLVEKMVQEIKDKDILQYKEDEDNTVNVADYIQCQILKKHIKKIVIALFRRVQQEGLIYPVKELIDAINQYLGQLGVYTVVAQLGGHYKNVESFYELIYDKTKGSNLDPIITEVDCPAYLVKYRDEAEDEWFTWSEGVCVGK